MPVWCIPGPGRAVHTGGRLGGILHGYAGEQPPRGPGPGRLAPLRGPRLEDVLVRLPLGDPRAVPGRAGLQREADRAAPHPHAGGGHAGVPVDHDPGGPDRAEGHAGGRRRAHDRGRDPLRPQRRLRRAADCGDPGGDQPLGERGGPLPGHRAGLPCPAPARGPKRTGVFAWYNLAGSFATALGALAGGWTVQALQGTGLGSLASYRVLVYAYAGAGLLLALLFALVSRSVEAPRAGFSQEPPGAPSVQGHGAEALRPLLPGRLRRGLRHPEHRRLLVPRPLGVSPGLLGSIFFVANVLAGFSALYAVRLARQIGLINTMVFTHIPSNVLLILVPLMPNLPLAIAVLLLRFSISQMDVPTRQSYTMAVVSPEERSAAAGVTGIARTTGAALSPALAGQLIAVPALLGAPFLIAGQPEDHLRPAAVPELPEVGDRKGLAFPISGICASSGPPVRGPCPCPRRPRIRSFRRWWRSSGRGAHPRPGRSR